jgi:ankyrin repeat protein
VQPLLILGHTMLTYRPEYDIDEDEGDSSDSDDEDQGSDDEFYTRTSLFPPGLFSLSPPRRSRLAAMTRLLFENEADPDVFSDDGSSLIEMAVRANLPEVVEVLLEHQKPFLPNYDDPIVD